MNARFLAVPSLVFGLSLLAHGADKNQLPERTEEQILKTVKLPEGYEATVFARPPEGGYPTAMRGHAGRHDLRRHR